LIAVEIASEMTIHFDRVNPVSITFIVPCRWYYSTTSASTSGL